MKLLTRFINTTTQTAALLALVLTIIWSPVSLENSNASEGIVTISKNHHGFTKDLPLLAVSEQTEENLDDHEDLQGPGVCQVEQSQFSWETKNKLEKAQLTGAKVVYSKQPVYLRVRSLLI